MGRTARRFEPAPGMLPPVPQRPPDSSVLTALPRTPSCPGRPGPPSSPGLLRGAWPALLVLALLAACSARDDARPRVHVAAAASLREPLEVLAAEYRAARGVEVVLDLGGSGRLAAQIEAGAPADLFLSAGHREMDRLGSRDRLRPGSRRALVDNALVVVVPAGDPSLRAPRDGSDLLHPRFRHVAIGNPASSPAGRYARTWLRAEGWWDGLEDRVVPCHDVRAALAAVERGAVEAGIVYRTDALASQGVEVAFEVVGSSAPTIVYPAALLAGSPAPAAAAAFLEFLASPGALATFAAHGFAPSDAPPTGSRAAEADVPRPSLLAPLLISLKVALAATAVVFLPGVLVGLLLSRRSFPGKVVLETLVELPLVLPPTAVGFALLVLFDRRGPLGPEALGFDPGILFTWRAAVLAAALMALPLVARGARIAFDAVDPRLETMAGSLGLSPWRVRWSVTLPLAWRGLLAAALLGFGRALGEFGATILVAGNVPGRTQTLALAIYDDWHARETGRAQLLVGVSVLVAFCAVAAVGWLQRRDARARGTA